MATINDVAKKAGVSVSTVSYAMSGSRPISEATRQRVFKAIDELGYHPNRLARSLASRRSKIIALLYPSAPSGYLDDIQLDFISSVASTASHYNYGLLLFTSPSGEKDIQRFINERLIDGLILMEVELVDPRVQLMKNLNYPFSLIGHCENNEGSSFVDLDFHAALHLSVEHLAALKHREIAFISSTEDIETSTRTYVFESVRGFNDAVTELGLTGYIRGSKSDPERACVVMEELLSEHPEITAVIASNDPIYGGVLKVLQNHGFKIPEDVSLIGLVSQQVAERYTPKVTSLTIPSNKMAQLSTEILLNRLEGHEPSPQQVMLEPKLTVRQSTGICKNCS